MKTALHPAQVVALQEMGIARRIVVNASLWDHARALKEATLRSQHRDWSEDRIRVATQEAFRAGR